MWNMTMQIVPKYVEIDGADNVTAGGNNGGFALLFQGFGHRSSTTEIGFVHGRHVRSEKLMTRHHVHCHGA